MSKQLKLPTLLVIADNPRLRFWVKKQLDEQFFIIAAERKQEAIDALNARLDFIIIDSEFEECDPLELCRTISQQSKKNITPILLVTGRLKKAYHDKAMQVGVTDFLSDQLDATELEMRIQEGLSAANVRQKTEDLSLSIKIPKMIGPNSLKKKFLMTDQALKLLKEAKNEGKPVALLFLRIDQEIKPEILKEFSQYVTSFLREKDLLIPSAEGGFILLLSNTKSDAARLIAEKLKDKIQAHPFGSIHLTVSIVVSQHEATEKEVNQMIDSAIKSLKAHSETNQIIDSEFL
jgi:two-component system cell cycle response regulator